MKKTILITLFYLLSFNAISGTVTGQVHKIRAHDTAVSLDWVQLKGVTASGNCAVTDGLVYFRIKDDERAKRHLSLLTTALVSGRSVRIAHADVTSGDCFIRYLDIY